MDWNRLFTASCSPDSFGPENLSKAQMIAKFLKDFNIPLEEAVALYSEAADLVSVCSKSIEKAKLEIEKIDNRE